MSKYEEVQEVHTRIVNMPLAVDESVSYWKHVDPGQPIRERAEQAYAERWFGNKSMKRVRAFLVNFEFRFDQFPEALAALHQWRPDDQANRRIICHWHLMLVDPLYRAFNGDLLESLRYHPSPVVERDTVVRWLHDEQPERWASATVIRIANNLLSSAAEAGILSESRGPRSFRFPNVSDATVAYLLYLLRDTQINETLFDNTYLRSVGVDAEMLETRMRRLPGIRYSRMGTLREVNWEYDNVSAWANGITHMAE